MNGFFSIIEGESQVNDFYVLAVTLKSPIHSGVLHVVSETFNLPIAALQRILVLHECTFLKSWAESLLSSQKNWKIRTENEKKNKSAVKLLSFTLHGTKQI